MQGADDLLCLLRSYMRMGMGVGVGRGVIVIVIWMIMVRVIRMIVGSVRLRWWMSINMVVVLVIWELLRSVYELENIQAKRPIGKSGKEQKAGGGGGGQSPFIWSTIIPFASPPATRKQARGLDDWPNRSSLPHATHKPTTHTTPGP